MNTPADDSDEMSSRGDKARPPGENHESNPFIAALPANALATDQRLRSMFIPQFDAVSLLRVWTSYESRSAARLPPCVCMPGVGKRPPPLLPVHFPNRHEGDH